MGSFKRSSEPERRYRPDWPVGVRPVFPTVSKMLAFDPEWAREYGPRSPYEGYAAFAAKYSLPNDGPTMEAGEFFANVERFLASRVPVSP